MHLLVLQGGGESGVVDSIPIAEVKVFVNSLVELAFSQFLSILGQLFVVKILWKADGVLLG